MERPVRGIVLGAGVLGSLMVSQPAEAQPDLYFRTALSVGGVADDNLFSTADSREEDVITRFTPGFETGIRSERLTVSGRLAIDAERFERHPELDNSRAREAAVFDFTSRAARHLTFSLHADSLSTLTAGELNPATGLAAGRARATRREVAPVVGWRIGPATVGTAAYGLTRDDLAGGTAATTRTATLGLERTMSSRDTVSAEAGSSRYDFAEGGPVAAQTLRLGWDRHVGPRTGFTLRAGPRRSLGRVDPEVSVAVHHDASRVISSLTLSRSLTTVIGRAGTVVAESAVPAVSWRATRALQLGVSPGLYRTRDALGGPAVAVYLLGLDATWRLDDWLSLVATCRRSVQRGTLDAAIASAGAGQTIARDTLLLSLVARQREPWAPAAAGPPAGAVP